MSTKIITARRIVSGVSDEQSPDVIEYAGLAYKDGIVLSLGPAAVSYTHLTLPTKA